MKKGNKILKWLPRILGILFICFISLFSFDVFGEYGFPIVLVALFMHLIPSLVLAGILAVAWKWEKIGGILFLILGIVFTLFFHTYEDLIVFLIVSLPVFLIGILFLINSRRKNVKKKK